MADRYVWYISCKDNTCMKRNCIRFVSNLRQTIYDLIAAAGKPGVNLWSLADHMTRLFVEYILSEYTNKTYCYYLNECKAFPASLGRTDIPASPIVVYYTCRGYRYSGITDNIVLYLTTVYSINLTHISKKLVDRSYTIVLIRSFMQG